MTISVLKASGEREKWDPEKLIRSLRASGAEDRLAHEILGHVEHDLYDGMKTSEIYRHAFSLLRKQHRPFAAEYSLKRSLMEFGPSGFPFEKFVAELLKHEGYTTKVGQMIPGACVTHEVDVIAENASERILVEAKFHNSPAIKTDVKVALYVHARFQDITKRFEEKEEKDLVENMHYNRAWLITNTSFTSQAIDYGRCVGLAMTGWNYPKGYTLQDLVQKTRAHPVTCLTTLNAMQKTQLLNTGIVLCRDLIANSAPLSAMGISHEKINNIVKEGEDLCPL